MTFDEYSKRADATAIYPERGKLSIYPVLGLCGESGEVAEKVKKWIRDGTSEDVVRMLLAEELGDVLWYVNAIAFEWNISLDYIARTNIEKLEDRKARDVLHGSGDNR